MGDGKLPPELLEWARHDLDVAEFKTGLQELEATGGMELKDFIHELEEDAMSRD